jgi:hypothetical protein
MDEVAGGVSTKCASQVILPQHSGPDELQELSLIEDADRMTLAHELFGLRAYPDNPAQR